MSFSLRLQGTPAALAASLDAETAKLTGDSKRECETVVPAVKRLLTANEHENQMELNLVGHGSGPGGYVHVGLGPMAGLILLALGLAFSFMPSVSLAAERKLPARVETNQVNPPVPQFQAADAPVVELVATNNTLPGQPVIKTAKAGRGLLAFIFGGRRCRRCSG